jgi:hypothetical protein
MESRRGFVIIAMESRRGFVIISGWSFLIFYLSSRFLPVWRPPVRLFFENFKLTLEFTCQLLP